MNLSGTLLHIPTASGHAPSTTSVDVVPAPAPSTPAHPSFPHLRGLSQPNAVEAAAVAFPHPRAPLAEGADAPGAVSTSRSSPLAAFIQRYEVGEAIGFRPLGLGMLNRGYHVVTTTGGYFLKHYLAADTAQIAFQHRVTAALVDHGVPALPPLRDRQGQSMATVGRRRFALFPWVMGHHLWGRHYTPTGARGIGRLLGRIHAGLHALLAPIQQPLLASAPHADASIATARRLLGLARARRTPDPVDVLAGRRLVERCELLARMAARRPSDHEPIRVGYVHGDFHPLNVLHGHEAADAEPVAVLDWDRVAVLPLTEELVRAAVLFFGRGDGTLDLDRIRAMIRGYHEVMDLPPEEYERGVHRLWWERLNDFWMLEWKYDLDDPRCDPQYPAAAALVPWWTDHYDEVRAAFTPTG